MSDEFVEERIASLERLVRELEQVHAALLDSMRRIVQMKGSEMAPQYAIEHILETIERYYAIEHILETIERYLRARARVNSRAQEDKRCPM